MDPLLILLLIVFSFSLVFLIYRNWIAAVVILAILIYIPFINHYVTKDKAEQTKIIETESISKQTIRTEIAMKLVMPSFNSEIPMFRKDVTVTAYTSRCRETDDSPYYTSKNKPVVRGGIALSRDLLEEIGYGKEVILEGYGVFTVNDTMNKRFKNSVDIWMGDLKAARLHGRQTTTLLWQ